MMSALPRGRIAMRMSPRMAPTVLLPALFGRERIVPVSVTSVNVIQVSSCRRSKHWRTTFLQAVSDPNAVVICAFQVLGPVTEPETLEFWFTVVVSGGKL